MIHFKEIQPNFNFKQDSWERQLCLSLHLPQAMDTQTAIAELQLMYRHAGKKNCVFSTLAFLSGTPVVQTKETDHIFVNSSFVI